MGRWGTRTYVNCHGSIVGVTLLQLRPLGQLFLFYAFILLFYMHLYSVFHLRCNILPYLRCNILPPPPEEGRTGASVTVGRVTSRVAVLRKADRAQPSFS